MNFKIGAKVHWKWLGRFIEGIVKETFNEPVSRSIKGKVIKRNGSLENPAYLLESKAGNLALKLQSELLKGRAKVQIKKNTPKIVRPS